MSDSFVSPFPSETSGLAVFTSSAATGTASGTTGTSGLGTVAVGTTGAFSARISLIPRAHANIPKNIFEKNPADPDCISFPVFMSHELRVSTREDQIYGILLRPARVVLAASFALTRWS